MKRDSIFYRIFQQFPDLLFDLLPNPPRMTQGYRFESIEVKETSFRIDGVLSPPDNRGTVFFSEVQMQPDSKLYERMFSEIGIYTYRHTEQFETWQAIAIYPTKSVEQKTTKIPTELFQSGRFLPIYLDQLGAIEQLPLGIALLVLTILEGEEAIAQAQRLRDRAVQSQSRDGIMDMLSTILVYKLTTLSRDEVNAMLNYTTDELKQTRFYQEVMEETREEMREEVREIRNEVREESRSIVLTFLRSKVGPIPSPLELCIRALRADRLQALSVALLDFKTIQDLEDWLQVES